MKRRYFGTLYLVQPNWQGDTEQAHQAVVGTFRHGPSYIEIAIELWRLAGNEDRVKEIESLLERVHDREDPILNAAEIDELIRLLEGLDTALRTSVVDSDWNVLPERLPEIRRSTTLLDVGEEKGALAVLGVSDGMSRVFELRDFLIDARQRGFHVALD